MKLTKHNLKKTFEPMSQKDRMDLLKQLYPLVDSKLKEHRLQIPAPIHQECVYVHSRACHTGKINWRNLAKLFLVAESNPAELKHWCMKGNNLYRKHNYYGTNSKHRTNTGRKRRPSIYGWSGDLIPRAFLDKAYPKWVKTQEDYDHYMEKRTGMDRTKYREQVLKMY